ncbi:hypothetical protein LJB90_03660 [Eubacteriales bacterium OttesenSCG-928-G02]|nr:hypothetical protein [Eubacteriales bacterium OttesenSCG-928-G02]
MTETQKDAPLVLSEIVSELPETELTPKELMENEFNRVLREAIRDIGEEVKD